MFAYVQYAVDKQLAKVPVGYIKHFDSEKYNPENVYKVFWSRAIHSIQNENDNASMAQLRSLREPPSKISWNISDGEGYYAAFILRLEDSLDALIESLQKKRQNIMPLTTQYEDDVTYSTTEDESSVLQLQKDNKKIEEAERKKHEQAAKRKRAEDVFKTAKKSRKGALKKLVFKNDSDSDGQQTDSDDDPEVIPSTKYTQLKAAFDVLEKDKEKVDNKFKDLEKKFSELQKQYEECRMDADEVKQLRSLNRQFQEKILELQTVQGGCCHASGIHEKTVADSETPEVELGAGISIDRKIYEEIFQLNHVRKFTKSLAVCIWGSTVLAGRSVTGKPCRNRNGPKKIVADDSMQTVVHTQDPKTPLTPDKLAVISGQMREYLLKRGKNQAEIEDEIKKRNRYISDKIQDICSNMLRNEAKK